MNRVVIEGRVGDEGYLQLSIPLGIEEAGRDVLVTVESVAAQKDITPEAWRTGVLATAGGWSGEFERLSEGALEEREPIP